ncbi:prolyl oligopeptidase family serine peptidase [Streptomyces sp. NPDC001068]|uniref:S9 family peptidase n=1 Tax=Streptomyces sp. NPDC001068 TaxID=3364544 RepID=UPI0036C75F11
MTKGQGSGGATAQDIHDRARAWLQDAERPGYGRVTRIGQWDVTPDGSHVAAVGTVLTGLDRPGRNVLCVIDTSNGDCVEHDVEVELVSCGPGAVAVAARGGLHWLDVARQTLTPGPALSGHLEQLRICPDGRRVLAVMAARQPARYDLAERVYAEPSQREPLVFTAEPEPFRQCYLVDRYTGAVRDITPAGLNVWEICWTGPDSALAVCSERPGESGWYDPHLARVDLTTAKAVRLYTPPTGRQLASPTGAGSRYAVIEATCSDRGVVAGDIVLLDSEGGAVRLDTHGVDVSALDSTPDGRLRYAGLRGLRTVIGEGDAESATVTEVWSTRQTFHGTTPQIRTDAAGRFHGFVESYRQRPRLVTVENTQIHTVFEPAHGGTNFMRDRAGTVEEISWTAADGLEIQGLLIVPDGPPPHPLVVNVHGGPVAAWRNRWGIGISDRYPLAPLLASEGYAVLHPNPRGSHGRGETFTRAVLGDMLGAPLGDLLSGVDHLVARGVADPARIAVTGTSYGAVVSLVLPAVDRRFAAAIAVSPVSDWISQHYTSDIWRFDELFLQDTPTDPNSSYLLHSPLLRIGHPHAPTLVTAGLRDKYTPAQQAVEAHQALLRNGVNTELVLYPSQGHGVRGFPETADHLGRTLEWLHRHLLRPPVPDLPAEGK